MLLSHLLPLVGLLLSQTSAAALQSESHKISTLRHCQTTGKNCPAGTITVSQTSKEATTYNTIQSAINALPNDKTPQTILIKAGTYTEQLNITRAGPITFLGETTNPKDATANRVRITWAAANKDSTGQSVDNVYSSVLVVAPTLESSLTGSGTTGYPVPDDTPFGNTDFRVYNVDFVNEWSDYSDGPAHALSLSRANGGFYYCGFFSYQDTVSLLYFLLLVLVMVLGPILLWIGSTIYSTSEHNHSKLNETETQIQTHTKP
jgi:pectinesterase